MKQHTAMPTLALVALALAGCAEPLENEANPSNQAIGSVSQAEQRRNPPPTGSVCQVIAGYYLDPRDATSVGIMSSNGSCCITYHNSDGTVDSSCYDCNYVETTCVPATVAQSNALALTYPGDQGSMLNDGVSLSLPAGGGTSPYTWWASGLPPGLSIDASSGVIGGATTTGGTFSVSVTAVDSSSPSQSASTAFAWTVIVPVCTPYEDVMCCAYASGCSCFGDQICNADGMGWGPCWGSSPGGMECQ
jgi:putative Ig domain-containing protein